MHEAELLLRNDTLVHAHRSLLTKSSAVPVEVEPLLNPPSISAVHGTTLPGSRRPAHSLRRLSARPLSSHSARRAGRHVMPAFCSLRYWPFDMPTQLSRRDDVVAASIAEFSSPFSSRERCSIISQLRETEIRSGASVKKAKEAFQDSPSISGFAPSSPSVLEMSGVDFRNVSNAGSSSISRFDCISAYGALDFDFSP